MYETVIAIDLETTGLDPARDEILEVGAAVLRRGEVVGRFSELCAIKAELSPAIIKLTGITPDQVADARPFATVLTGLLDLLAEHEDALCIAHNAAFDRAFLREKSAGLFTTKILDTVGLSRICYPRLESHALGFLAEVLELPPQAEHRALADALTTLALWRRLEEKLAAFPPELLKTVNYLLAPAKTHPYRELFRRLEEERFSADFGKRRGSLVGLFKDHKALLETKPPVRDFERDHGGPEPPAVAEIFSPGGALAGALPGFESREGQAAMARQVAAALGEDQHLMVEAPTGIGKSLAYLVPVALFSAAEGYPVILSTNTKNLQSQLYEKDIPLVREALGLDFKSAIIKGRGNYLCLRKLLYVLDNVPRELERDERMQMVVLLSWALETETGDISECTLTGRPNFPPLWAKLRTLGDECMGRGCRCRTRCFLRRARALSLQADLVVANHALVFAEMNMESAVIPEYRQIVFDEAHNLEDAATDHLTVEVSQARLQQVLSRLYRARRRAKSGTGLVASVLQVFEKNQCEAPGELIEMADKNAAALAEQVQTAQKAVTPFLESLETVLPPGAEGTVQRRYAEGRKRRSVWEGVEARKEALVAALAQVMRTAEALVENLREMPPKAMKYLRDYQRELEAIIQWLREIIADVEFVLAGSEANYVYWIEKTHPKRGGAIAYAAPLSIAELMHDQVYARKQSCVFCSATLTVRDTFDFLAGRLGIDRIGADRLRTLQAPSPFDYDEQCFVAVPTFLPEPGGRNGRERYEAALASLLTHVYRLTEGRGMALFTSYAMLRDCYRLLTEKMVGDGIAILAQGESGSREGITSRFMRDVHSVLLGTHSFWEGVDVVGEALSCLTIARLPFAVYTDPIVEARCEQVEAGGQGAFMHYSVPNAVIRFKQGFGRLIRSRTDRGLIIIADRRVVAKRYGQVFLDSLPTGTETFNNLDTFLEAVEEFFSDEPGGDEPPA